MSNVFHIVKGVIQQDSQSLLTAKSALKQKLYSWFTLNQNYIADTIRDEKLRNRTATKKEFITPFMLYEYMACTDLDRNQIFAEFLAETGIQLNMHLSGDMGGNDGNIYVTINIVP